MDLAGDSDGSIYMGHRRTRIRCTKEQQCKQRARGYRFVVIVCEMDRSLLRFLPAWNSFNFVVHGKQGIRRMM